MGRIVFYMLPKFLLKLRKLFHQNGDPLSTPLTTLYIRHNSHTFFTLPLKTGIWIIKQMHIDRYMELNLLISCIKTLIIQSAASTTYRVCRMHNPRVAIQWNNTVSSTWALANLYRCIYNV